MRSTAKLLPHQKQSGFTLVELALILVLVGLLIGGSIRGAELINSAKVRNIIDQRTAFMAAYYGFQDRYRMHPGDLTAAQALLIGQGATPAFVGPGDGAVQWQDSPQFFNNLAQTGFIVCPPCANKLATQPISLSTTNSPANTYGAPIWFESASGGTATGGLYITPIGTTGVAKPKLSTGSSVGADLLAEIDRKIDDGNPSTGHFRVSVWSWTFTTPLSSCIDTATNNTWISDDSGQCQAVSLL